MSNYIRKMKRLTLPQGAGNYQAMLFKHVKFLTNDKNTLYFEYSYDSGDGKLPEAGMYYFSILPYNEADIIPNGYEYLCSFTGDDDIRYFIYCYDSTSSIFGKFANMFGGFGL